MAQLCHTGYCILVGGGGNKVTEGLPNATRVRRKAGLLPIPEGSVIVT